MQTFIDKTIKPVFIIGGIGTADGQDPRPFELGHKSPASCVRPPNPTRDSIPSASFLCTKAGQALLAACPHFFATAAWPD